MFALSGWTQKLLQFMFFLLNSGKWFYMLSLQKFKFALILGNEPHSPIRIT